MSILKNKVKSYLSSECNTNIDNFSTEALERVKDYVESLSNSKGCLFHISELYCNRRNRSEVIEVKVKNDKNEEDGISLII